MKTCWVMFFLNGYWSQSFGHTTVNMHLIIELESDIVTILIFVWVCTYSPDQESESANTNNSLSDQRLDHRHQSSLLHMHTHVRLTIKPIRRNPPRSTCGTHDHTSVELILRSSLLTFSLSSVRVLANFNIHEYSGTAYPIHKMALN